MDLWQLMKIRIFSNFPSVFSSENPFSFQQIRYPRLEKDIVDITENKTKESIPVSGKKDSSKKETASQPIIERLNIKSNDQEDESFVVTIKRSHTIPFPQKPKSRFEFPFIE